MTNHFCDRCCHDRGLPAERLRCAIALHSNKRDSPSCALPASKEVQPLSLYQRVLQSVKIVWTPSDAGNPLARLKSST